MAIALRRAYGPERRRRALSRPVLTLLAALTAACALGALLAGCGQGAIKPNELTVYAAEKQEIVDVVKPLWAKVAPDIKLNVITGGSTEIIQRVRSEASNPLGDVVWGSGAEGVSYNAQLFEAYAPQEQKAVDPRWLEMAAGEPWIPNNLQPQVIVYNTKLVKPPDAPRGWRDLAAPRWKDKLAYADAEQSGSAYTQLAVMVAVFGDNPAGWKVIAQIMRNAKIVTSSSRVPKGVADGEYAVGITYENTAGFFVKGGAPMKIVYPVEGTALTPDCNALIKRARHPAAAKRFLDFLVSKPVQERLAQTQSLRSCRTDVAAFPGLPPLAQVKAAPNFDFRAAVERRKDVIKQWLDIVAQLPQ